MVGISGILTDRLSDRAMPGTAEAVIFLPEIKFGRRSDITD
jgi:hypothetical protein